MTEALVELILLAMCILIWWQQDVEIRKLREEILELKKTGR